MSDIDHDQDTFATEVENTQLTFTEPKPYGLNPENIRVHGGEHLGILKSDLGLLLNHSIAYKQYGLSDKIVSIIRENFDEIFKILENFDLYIDFYTFLFSLRYESSLTREGSNFLNCLNNLVCSSKMFCSHFKTPLCFKSVTYLNTSQFMSNIIQIDMQSLTDFVCEDYETYMLYGMVKFLQYSGSSLPVDILLTTFHVLFTDSYRDCTFSQIEQLTNMLEDDYDFSDFDYIIEVAQTHLDEYIFTSDGIHSNDGEELFVPHICECAYMLFIRSFIHECSTDYITDETEDIFYFDKNRCFSVTTKISTNSSKPDIIPPIHNSRICTAIISEEDTIETSIDFNYHVLHIIKRYDEYGNPILLYTDFFESGLIMYYDYVVMCVLFRMTIYILRNPRLEKYCLMFHGAVGFGVPQFLFSEDPVLIELEETITIFNANGFFDGKPLIKAMFACAQKDDPTEVTMHMLSVFAKMRESCKDKLTADMASFLRDQ